MKDLVFASMTSVKAPSTGMPKQRSTSGLTIGEFDRVPHTSVTSIWSDGTYGPLLIVVPPGHRAAKYCVETQKRSRKHSAAVHLCDAPLASVEHASNQVNVDLYIYMFYIPLRLCLGWLPMMTYVSIQMCICIYANVWQRVWMSSQEDV